MRRQAKVDPEGFRSDCSIARALDLLGDRWTLLIVRDLMWHGKHTFQALSRSDERIPSNLLADRLTKLQRWGLVEREAYQDRPVRYRYDLTPLGRTLEPLLKAAMDWGFTHLGGGFHDPSGAVPDRKARRPKPRS
ncbi:MAG: helix-turn-helix domain-containing protein [Gemmatimonadota bacterium]